ncbi:hypothetical protein DFH09DRAFT_1076570 [Mycena vulgaris]|nr:hypothetical protein DFH09DRAFT_1076570 [Mycena vulgaris]
MQGSTLRIRLQNTDNSGRQSLIALVSRLSHNKRPPIATEMTPLCKIHSSSSDLHSDRLLRLVLVACRPTLVFLTARISGALLATILLTYSDGTTDTLRSDSSWRVHAEIPVGFEQLSFDDTAWAVATVAGAYGAEPWETVNIPSDPPVITLNRAQWVGTDLVPASGKVPTSSRVFRRTFPLAPGQVPLSASILITADNEYTLYVNGVAIGSGANWRVAQHYTVNFQAETSEIVVAVAASNTNTAASTAGVILAMEVNMRPSGWAECTAGAFLLTDAGWVSTKGAIPVGWEQPGFDDSAWPVVVAEETYGGPTWGTITIAAPSPVVTV